MDQTIQVSAAVTASLHQAKTALLLVAGASVIGHSNNWQGLVLARVKTYHFFVFPFVWGGLPKIRYLRVR